MHFVLANEKNLAGNTILWPDFPLEAVFPMYIGSTLVSLIGYLSRPDCVINIEISLSSLASAAQLTIHADPNFSIPCIIITFARRARKTKQKLNWTTSFEVFNSCALMKTNQWICTGITNWPKKIGKKKIWNQLFLYN